MPRLEKVYLSEAELPELSKEFYRSYNDDYWYAKIEMYEYLLDHVEDVFSEDSDLNEKTIDQYRRYIKSEIHHLFYHSTEALLGLVRSIANEGIPWIDLKETHTYMLDDFVENELQNDDYVDTIKNVFYPDDVVSDPKNRGVIEESAQFIHKYLKRIGYLFSSRDVYNEYKHGLRLLTTSAEITLQFERDPEAIDEEWRNSEKVEITDDGIEWVGMDDDILSYLAPKELHQDEDTGKKYWSLARKEKAMEYERYNRFCSTNSLLIELIFGVRKMLLDTDFDGKQEADLTIFTDEDIDDLFEYKNPMNSFTINRYFPKDSDDTLVYNIPK
jgi:hypothetical protein